MASKTAAKPAAKKPAPKKAPARKPAPKKQAPKKAATKAAETVELTSVNDVQIKVGDAHAEVRIVGRFDLDGLIAVTKRVDRARAELS